MNLIYDSYKPHQTSIRVKAEFAVGPRQSAGEITVMMRRKVSQAVTEKMLDRSDMFSIKIEKGYGEVAADIVALTHEELADLLRKQFRAGVAHASGFRPNEEWTPTT